MDRIITKEEKLKDTKKKYFRIGTGIIFGLGILYLVNGYLTKKIDRKDISIGIVEKGNVALTISGSGKIEPTLQKAITSPFSSFIEATHKGIGDEVKSDESLLQINVAEAENTLSSMKDEAEMKRVEINKEKLRLNKELFNLKKETQINALQLKSREEALKSETKLLEIGGSTEEKVKQAKTLLEIENLKQEQLTHDLKIKEQGILQEIKSLELSLSIQLKSIQEQERKLEKAKTKTGMDGVITFIKDKVGASIAEGEVLARVANMDQFRIRGKVSEQYVASLSIGMDVLAKTSKATYSGSVTSISPSSENGMITVLVQIDEQEGLHLLRPDMIVDLSIIREQHENVLRVKNRGAFKGVKGEKLFMIKNGIAEKVTIQTGFRNSEWVELKSNVQEGDSIIISPTDKFINSPHIELK
ncbi:efflux RND transporter periplasmic adaptor subunit [Flammeovirga aprica]|uniref:HlyD family efflux transporter periplasmic adaptor subunit n=1 Tax=Flammeovirga aprica JL-4 TaxID=694437 RepID=A0A7X9P0Y3_9BACT|nr:HlyD family efflux transporter periplasmic adaptor subunit [Flammeovirga aprica]NME67539.1 HlyD family efflux transporter periplasmic adaptor subunit [Flammeovirga aprica JL-4]